MTGGPETGPRSDQAGLSQTERANLARAIYRSAKKRGATESMIKGLLALRTGKTSTREIDDESLRRIRDEIVGLPAIGNPFRVPKETRDEYDKRQRRGVKR